MIDDADLLDRYLEHEDTVASERIRELSLVAELVTRVLAGSPLTDDVRERIRALVFEPTPGTRTIIWDVVRGRSRSIAGGAALTLAAAAVGIAVLRVRRQHTATAAA